MNNWLQAMKQWTQWLMGDAPLPDGRSAAMLAGTVATAAVIAVGVPAAIPSSPSATAASKQVPSANQDTSSSQYTLPTTATTVAPSPVVGAGTPTTTTVPGSSGFDPLATGSGTTPNGKGKARRVHHRKGSAPPASTGTTPTGAPLVAPTTAAALAAPAADPFSPVSAAVPTAPAAPTAPTAPTALAPIDTVTTLVTPAAPPPPPLATGAAALVDSALVTWKPPAGATAGGYDVFVGLAPGMEFPVALNGANPVAGTSFLATGLTAGRTYYFTVRARAAGVSSSASNEVTAVPYGPYAPLGQLAGPVISMASTADGTGYWLATASGAVSAHGSAADLGGMGSQTLVAPIVKIVGDPKGAGYWEVAADGGVFTFGTAHFEGAASTLPLRSPIVDMVPTADGLGYWEVAADGGIFAYGDAAFAGSLGGTTLTSPIVGMAADSATGGYWLVAADGAVTAFDAPAIGPAPTALPVAPVVGIAAATDGHGFWEVTRGGAVYAYGDAAYLGPDAPLRPNAPIEAVTADRDGSGYWLAGADGAVFAYDAGFFGVG